MSANPQRASALSMLVLVSLLWGLSFPMLKAIAAIHDQLVPGGGSWFVTAWSVAPRFIVAGAVLALVLRRQLAALTALEIRQGTSMAFFLSLGLLFQVDGLQHTSASVSAFLTQVYVVLIPLYFAMKWRRVPRWIVMAACALVLAGIAILARIDIRDLRLGRGEAETLLGSVFFTGQILWLERPRFAANNAWRMSFVMFAWLAVGFTILAAFLAPEPAALLVPWTDPGWLGLTIVLGLVCTLFCFTAMNRWQPQITSTEAGLIYSLEPVSVAVLALFTSTRSGTTCAFPACTRDCSSECCCAYRCFCGERCRHEARARN
jgi:drug/metabolite transporter (DMT)-like permease